MKKLTTVLFLLLITGGTVVTQDSFGLLKDIRKIKLLESTRDDVRRILNNYNYNPTDYDDYYQTFSKGDVNVTVSYSDGTCSDDPDEDDNSRIWATKAWKVTRIEVALLEPLKLADIDFDLSKFKKENRYPDDADSLIFHDKPLGLAFKTTKEGIERIIFFPQSNKTKGLCKGNAAAKQFYSRESWFTTSRPYDFVGGLINQFANVEELNLGASEIEATSGKMISVTTVATDPENDILTYNYTISAGRIKGNGAKVVWDLTGLTKGTYTIKVGVDDGAGVIGKTATSTVIIK